MVGHLTLHDWIASLRKWLRDRLAKPVIKHPKRRTTNLPKTVVINREEEGAFFYLKDVLGSLRQCQTMLRKLRRWDRTAYDYHSRVGAKVMPSKIEIYLGVLSKEFLERRPGNGMTLLFEKNEKEYYPQLFFLQKMVSPIDVQSTIMKIYMCSSIFFVKKVAYGITYHVAVSKSGDVKLLRERQLIMQKLPKKRRVLHRMGWGHNESLMFWYRERIEALKSYTLEEYAVFRFCATANMISYPADDELLIRCTKNNITAAFNVSTKRTPYFFNDRQTTLAVDGKRKRIFHIVREHTRILESGHISNVKEHYRGERKFTWGGHDVVISLPAKQELVNIGIAAIYDDDEIEGRDLMTSAELGDKIVTELEGEPTWPTPLQGSR